MSGRTHPNAGPAPVRTSKRLPHGATCPVVRTRRSDDQCQHDRQRDHQHPGQLPPTLGREQAFLAGRRQRHEDDDRRDGDRPDIRTVTERDRDDEVHHGVADREDAASTNGFESLALFLGDNHSFHVQAPRSRRLGRT
jgi:hypothetical protein